MYDNPTSNRESGKIKENPFITHIVKIVKEASDALSQSGRPTGSKHGEYSLPELEERIQELATDIDVMNKEDTTEIHLRPCPFCGSKLVEVGTDSFFRFSVFYWVKCDECGMLSGRDRDVLKVVNLWNKAKR